MKQKIREANLPWMVDSAGTGFWHVGELPDRRSVVTARQRGIDITDQRARQFHAADFDRFDQIFVMDTQNRQDVLRLAQTDAHRAKIALMLDEIYPGEDRSVPDPYHDDNGFEEVFDMLDQACEAFVKRVATS